MVTAVIGIVVLFIISQVYKLEYTKTYDITQNQIGRDVRVKGTINSVKEFGKTFLIEVSEEKPITVVVFRDGSNNNFSEGSRIEVFGQVREYKGKLEIVAEKVITVDD